MHYENYLSYLLEHNDLIYVDTSTLMNSESLQLFINKAEDEFVARNKRMIITQWVQTELNKHIQSENTEKKNQAISAWRLLTHYQDIFVLEDETKSIGNATFADSDLLSKLTLNKSTATQLLITYDRCLALDAYNLNHQSSNKGGKVMVCHINKAGYVKKCDCVNISNEQKCEQVEPEIIIQEKQAYVDRAAEPVIINNTKGWKIPVAIASGFAGGIAFEKFAWPFIKKSLLAV